MEFLEIEMILFFAKKIISFLDNDETDYQFLYDLGKENLNNVCDYLIDNNEIKVENLGKLNNYKNIFMFNHDEIKYVQDLMNDIKQGKESWKNLNVDYASILNKLLEMNFINIDEKIRYLAHHNHYEEIIEICDDENSHLILAKKYGSIDTRLNLKKYELMKNLKCKLNVKNILEKKIKI